MIHQIQHHSRDDTQCDVADDAFTLIIDIMAPFPFKAQTGFPRIEESPLFGLSLAVFRIFGGPIAVNPDTDQSLVLACINLHIF